MILNTAFSSYNIHGYAFNGTTFIEPVLLVPGEYYLGDLQLSISEDITEQVTTYVSFSGCPEFNFYTGFANLAFFEPVLVDAEITITPTVIESGKEYNIPQAISINAYPNPFNSSVNLEVISHDRSELVIYDVLGREIRDFVIVPGLNKFAWDATDNSGAKVNTGTYFAKIDYSTGHSVRKLLYLK